MRRLETWEQEIAAAQRERTFVIGRRKVPRIPFGSERPRWRMATCGDCGTKRGQLHVVGCDIEQCPACFGQAIMCGCRDGEEDAEWRPSSG
jgi:hypothetical protein